MEGKSKLDGKMTPNGAVSSNNVCRIQILNIKVIKGVSSSRQTVAIDLTDSGYNLDSLCGFHSQKVSWSQNY